MLTLASVYIIMKGMIKEKRHKCHCCGAVRNEVFMNPLSPGKANASSQFGNDRKCWVCKKCLNPENCKKRWFYQGGREGKKICQQDL